MKELIITAALAIVLAGCTKEDKSSNQPPSDPCAALVANCTGNQNYLKMVSDGYDTLAVELLKRGDFGSVTVVGSKRILIVGNCMAFDVTLGNSYYFRIQGIKGSGGQHAMVILPIDNVKSCQVHEFSYY
jgi:hypothetical protein